MSMFFPLNAAFKNAAFLERDNLRQLHPSLVELYFNFHGTSPIWATCSWGVIGISFRNLPAAHTIGVYAERNRPSLEGRLLPLSTSAIAESADRRLHDVVLSRNHF